MLKRLLILCLLSVPAFADTVFMPDSEPYFCDVNPDGYFLATETYPTDAEAHARAPIMADEYSVDVEVICTNTDRYVYSPAPPPPPSVDPFEGCNHYRDRSGRYECPPNNRQSNFEGYTEEEHSSGWWIYTPIDDSEPPPPPPPPDPPPLPPPGGPPPMPSGEYVGIPMPSFGIDETVSDSEYTHWIDNTVTCSDSGNGTPSAPRCTIPGSFAAGSIVQLRGTFSEMLVTFNGTKETPIFLRGPSNGLAVFNGRKEGLNISGQYAIIEYVDLRRAKLSGESLAVSFIAIRNSLIHEPNPPTGSMIFIGGNNIVLLNNKIFGNGPVTDPKDRHGINIGGAAFNIWILENEIYLNGGDGIQFCHECATAKRPGPGAIYIANNHIHEDKENAMDFKAFRGPVIVSGNDLWGYRRITSGQGEAIRVNNEGDQGELWMVRNYIHDTMIGIGPDRSDADSYAIDNIFERIGREAIGGGITGGQAGNTIDGVSDGIDPEPLYALFESRFGISIRP